METTILLQELLHEKHDGLQSIYPIKLAMVEIYPQKLGATTSFDDKIPLLSPFIIKMHLLKSFENLRLITENTKNSRLSGKVVVVDNPDSDRFSKREFLELPSQSVTATEIFIPCLVRGYALLATKNSCNSIEREINENSHMRHCVVSQDTIVRIIKESVGVQTVSHEEKERDKYILSCHDHHTVETISYKITQLLENHASISTTSYACKEKKELRSSRLLSISQQVSSCTAAAQKKVMKYKTNKENFLFKNTKGLLLYNSTHASGKTSLVSAIARSKLSIPNIYLLQPSLLLAQYGANQIDVGLACILHSLCVSAAIKNEPICIILDHFDAFLPQEKDVGDPTSIALQSVSSYLCNLLDSLSLEKRFPFPSMNMIYDLYSKKGIVLDNLQVCFVAVTTCHESFQYRDFFGDYLNLPIKLQFNTRYHAFLSALKYFQIHLKQDEAKNELEYIAYHSTFAYGTYFETFAKLLYRNLLKTLKKRPLIASKLDLQQCNHQLRNDEEGEESRIESNIFTAEEMLDECIGGNTKAKYALLDSLAIDREKKLLLKKFGMNPPIGVLLYGPPGTGKTLLARTISKILSSSTTSEKKGCFISLEANEIITNEVGTSEKIIVNTFMTARTNTPCVIFIDEFQAMFIARQTGKEGEESQGGLATTLLQCMDEVKYWNEADERAVSDAVEGATTTHVDSNSNRIIILAATNLPWMVDNAFLRTGRFDRMVYVGLPNCQEREEIFNVYLKNMKFDQRISSKKLATLCQGFSGADIFSLCRLAAIRCVGENNILVSVRNFLDALMYDVAKSCDDEIVDRLMKWRK